MRFVLILALATCACQAVPDVIFDDGGVGDAIDESNTCPNMVPPYASVCCGPIPCIGSNCEATCNDCMASCKLSDLCCPNAQNRAVCRTNATTCP